MSIIHDSMLELSSGLRLGPRQNGLLELGGQQGLSGSRI